LKKGWRHPFCVIRIFYIPKELEDRLLISRAAHDQYATIPEKYHVIQNMVFSQKQVKASRTEGL
jgi:hypothetical protein